MQANKKVQALTFNMQAKSLKSYGMKRNSLLSLVEVLDDMHEHDTKQI